MPAWFAEQVDRMTEPELPAFETATGALSGTNEEPSSGGSSSRRADDTGRAIGTHETGESSPGADRSHPLSDVWGDG